MKNIFFSLLFVCPLILFGQVTAHTWNNGTGNSNWNDAGNWTNGVPNAPNTRIYLSSASNTTINLDMNAEVGQIAIQTGSGNAVEYTITGSNTLTINGGVQNYTIVNNAPNNKIYFDCNVTIATNDAGANEVIRANQASEFHFNAGKTVTLNTDFKTNANTSNGLCKIYFKGTVAAANTRTILVQNGTRLFWESTVNTTNYLGDIEMGESSTNAVEMTVNGPLTLRNFKQFGGTDKKTTVGTTGSLVASGELITASGTLNRIHINTSRTASGSVIAKTEDTTPRLTFNRALDANEWALVSMPGGGEQIKDVKAGLLKKTVGGNDNVLAFGYWSPAASNFGYYDDDGAGTNYLTVGRGYIMKPQNAQNTIFEVTMKVDDQTRALTDGAGTYGNWNLLGNPFPSYLNSTDQSGEGTNNFLDVNLSKLHADYQAIYSWDGTQYVTHNHASGSGFIAPGEGFFVKIADGDNQTASFTEAMQEYAKGANYNASIARNDFIRESFVDIQIEDQDNNDSDHIKLYFSDNSTKGLDGGYDAGKFFQEKKSKIFTRLVEDDQGTDFQIQALPYSDLSDAVIPLGITTNSSSLKLSIKENSIDHLYSIYLEDKLNNTIVELDKPIEIEIDNNSNGIGRFYLHFTDSIIPELPTDGDDFRIFKVSNSEIKLMGSPETMYNAKVYDFSGRLVREVNFNHRININEIDSRGINILTIESNDKKLTKKFKLN